MCHEKSIESAAKRIEELVRIQDEMRKELDNKSYWVVTLIHPTQGAVHYTCRTEDGAWKVARQFSARIEKFYIKRHLYSDC